MLISCWSVKGGSGTTVVAVALALSLRSSAAGVLLVDLLGDVPSVLALPAGRPAEAAAAVDAIDPMAPSGLGAGGADPPGVTDWLAAGADVPPDALPRLEQPIDSKLSLLPRGRLPLGDTSRVEVFSSVLATDARSVVVDAGLVGPPVATGEMAARELAGAVSVSAVHSFLVLRPCLLALRRAIAAPIRPTGIILVAEPQRALSALDIEDALEVPVRAVVRFEPAIARAVDAGTLATAPPRSLMRALRDVA